MKGKFVASRVELIDLKLLPVLTSLQILGQSNVFVFLSVFLSFLSSHFDYTSNLIFKMNACVI